MTCPPTSKQAEIFSPLARKIPPRSHPPLKHAPLVTVVTQVFRQPEGRHNTLDFAIAKSCAKGVATPFGIPRSKCGANHKKSADKVALLCHLNFEPKCPEAVGLTLTLPMPGLLYAIIALTNMRLSRIIEL